MLDVVIGKRGHGVVAVVVVGLIADIDALLVTRFLCRFGEVLGQELPLLVEIVARSLEKRTMTVWSVRGSSKGRELCDW